MEPEEEVTELRRSRLIELIDRATRGDNQTLVEMVAQMTDLDLEWVKRTQAGKKMIRRFEALPQDELNALLDNLEEEDA
jgi:hypothetical protein